MLCKVKRWPLVAAVVPGSGPGRVLLVRLTAGLRACRARGCQRASVADETMEPQEGFGEAEPGPGARGEQVGDSPVGRHAVVAGLCGPGDDGFAECPARAQAPRLRDDSGEGEEPGVIGPGQRRVAVRHLQRAAD